MRRLLLSLLLLLLPVAAIAEPTQIVAGLEEDIRGSDPQRERDALSDAVHLHVVEGLVGFREDLEVGPMLASRIDIEEDGRLYVVSLRPDVRFHNGAPLTAAAVKWSWDYVMAPNSLWRCRPLLLAQGADAAALTVRDEHTVLFRLPQANANFLRTLARPDCAQTPVLHPDSVGPDGAWRGPVGTGPFVLVRRGIGQYADVRRFEGYVPRQEPADGLVGRKEALVDRIRFLVIGDPAARVMGLQSGDLDIGIVPSHLVAALRNAKRLSVVTSETTSWVALLLNDRDPLLQNRALRQAIAAAVDRDMVAQGVSFGQALGTAGRVPRSSRSFRASELDHARVEPTRVRALLQQAGYTGQPVRIVTNKRYAMMYDAALLVQNLLQAAGINAVLDVVEWSLQLEQLHRRDYQAQLLAYSGRYTPTAAWESMIGPEPIDSWQDETAIRLLHEAERTLDPALAQDSLDRLQQAFLEHVPSVGLYFSSDNLGVNRRLHGVAPSPFELLHLWNVRADPTEAEGAR